MGSMLDTLIGKPRRQRLVFWFGFLFIVVTLAGRLLLYPGLMEYRTLSEKVSTSESTILAEHLVASRLDPMKADTARLNLQLRQAVSQLTDKSQADDLLQNISNSAQNIGLELKLFQRKEERIGSQYVEIPVAISVSGTFQEVQIFFDSVNRLPGLVTIDHISLSNPRHIETRLVIQADCLMTAHRLLSPEERDVSPTLPKGK